MADVEAVEPLAVLTAGTMQDLLEDVMREVFQSLDELEENPWIEVAQIAKVLAVLEPLDSGVPIQLTILED